MKTLPMDYLKILTFNEKFKVFKDYDKKFLAGELAEGEISNYFWSLKSLLAFYCKYIRYQYKKQGIVLNLPIHILEQARKDNYIKDANTWIEHIKWVNYYLCQKDTDFNAIMLDILSKFRGKVDSMLELMHSEKNNQFVEENHTIYKEFMSREKILSDNIPDYSCEDMHISQYSYKIFLEFFKSHPQIKRVWLHGSRAYGTSDIGSDLDLILDCEENSWNQIEKELSELPTPYFVDAKNITYNGTSVFSAINYGNIKIYDSKDFQVY